MDSVFRAGGLASGMDTNSIVEQLVKLESRPLDQLRQRQTGIKTQLSALADIVSKLSALGTAAKDLGTSGVLGAKAVSANDAFSAVPGSDAVAGRYSVKVTQLARAAKWRTEPFAAGATHPGGSFRLEVQGKLYPPDVDGVPQRLQIPPGTSLADVAFKLRSLNAPLSVAVLNDGTSSYLSITNRDTGAPASGEALSIDWDPTVDPPPEDPPLYAEKDGARNATFEVDGLPFTRPSNTVSDAIPGTTLTLKKENGVEEDLVLATDLDATRARLQKFVDAYNDVFKLVQRQLNPSRATDRGATLGGDAAIRGLQAKLQGLLTTKVGASTVRALADLGVKTGRDGSLTITATALEGAVARDPAAVNALFSTATTGLSAVIERLVNVQTRSDDGALTARKSGLDDTLRRLDVQAEAMQRRIDGFREGLVRQFAAMEKTVSGLKSIGNFLNAQQQSSQSK
jgi:flagellar hook-associated protein 2